MCPAICGDSGPMSLPYSSDFPGQLKNWLRVQGVSAKLYCSGQEVLLCSTSFQPQDCPSLLNFLLLDATGLPAALPSTRQRTHPWAALETSTLRRMSLVQHSSCYRVPEAIGIPGLLDAIGLGAAGTCSSLLVATWTQLFLLPFDFESPSSSSWCSWSSGNS